jgi:hypothetical protein
MRAVSREEVLDYVTYEEQRPTIREQVFAAKAVRRIHVGPHLTFLFENRLTVRYQVQEMMRVERLVKEAEIRHELETYNELLGGPGELGASLLIEIDDAVQRAEKLSAWHSLMQHVYVKLEDGSRIPARYDRRQVGETRLSSVQYLKFDTKGRVPVAVGADHHDYTAEQSLNAEQREALAADLADEA